MRKRLIAAACVLAVGVAGCGDDGDTKADAKYAAFCQAELAVERAVNQEQPDGAAVDAAFAALSAATPQSDKGTVDDTIAQAKKMMSAEGPPSAEFENAYAKLVGVVQDHCGFGDVKATAKDYRFDGLPKTTDAGPHVVTLKNEGNEGHEMTFLRINDGVTLSAKELVELPEEQARSQVQAVGGGWALPGTTGHAVVDLQPGRYVVACFVPVGATKDAIESGKEPQGPPHALQGMVSELQVR